MNQILGAICIAWLVGCCPSIEVTRSTETRDTTIAYQPAEATSPWVTLPYDSTVFFVDSVYSVPWQFEVTDSSGYWKFQADSLRRVRVTHKPKRDSIKVSFSVSEYSATIIKPSNPMDLLKFGLIGLLAILGLGIIYKVLR